MNYYLKYVLSRIPPILIVVINQFYLRENMRRSIDKFVEYLNRDVSIDLYTIPGIASYIQNPKKGVMYVKGEMKVGVALSVVFTVSSMYATCINIGYYSDRSFLLAFSVLWIVCINLMALIPKVFVYQKLASLGIERSNQELRVEMMGIFKKRYYLYNSYVSSINVASYLISIPISIYLWNQNVHECFDLLLYSMVYILRCSYGVYRYNRYFLDLNDGSNGFGLRIFRYSLDDAEKNDKRLAEDKECSICLMEYLEGDFISEFSCSSGHYFHRDCLNKYLENKSSCPMCRCVAGS